MTHYLQLFLSAFALVACKAYQQENVIHRYWKLIPPTSYVFAFFELMVLDAGVGVVLDGGMIEMVIGATFLGTGAWLGAFLAMKIHDRNKNVAS